MTAGYYPTTQPFPVTDKQSLINLASASQLYATNQIPKAEHIIYILCNKHRYLANAILFGTDTELSLMIQLQDEYGFYTSSKISVVITLSETIPNLDYIDTNQLQAQYFVDGLWGVHYRLPMPSMSLSVQFTVTTYDDMFNTSDDRIYTYTDFPNLINNIIKLGQSLRSCPRVAHTHALVTVQLNTTQKPDLVDLSCSLSVPQRRIQFQQYTDGTYQVNITVESLLRANDIRLKVLNSYKTKQYYIFSSSYDLPCPAQLYFSEEGIYEPLPPHATTPDCYGFECDDGFIRSDQFCIAKTNTWFWTIIVLVVLFLFCWGFCVLLVGVWMREKSDITIINDVKEEEDDIDMEGVLPIGVTEDGDLEFEMVSDDDSSDRDSLADVSALADESP